MVFDLTFIFIFFKNDAFPGKLFKNWEQPLKRPL